MFFQGLLHRSGIRSASHNIAALFGGSPHVASFVWLSAGFLLILAAVLYRLHRLWFWLPAIVGICISQTMIMIHWPEAWYGTVVNVLILVVVSFSAAVMHFQRMVDREVAILREGSQIKEKLVTDEMIRHLPETVRQWMLKSNVVGRPTPGCLRVEQKGRMKTRPGGKWLDFQAVQHFSIEPPSFVWDTKIKAAPFVTIAGKDRYHEGHGNMLIKPLYIFTAGNGSGKEIDQGTLLRYLAELAWFPQAAVSDYLRWESITSRQTKVTMAFGGMSASGVYSFNEEGFVSGFEARRYGDFGGIYRKELWSVAVTGHKTFNDTRIGHKSEVTWKLSEGDFTWLEMEVTDIR